MPKSPDTTTVTVDKAGQTSVTIPRGLARTLSMVNGQKVKWRVIGERRLEVNV